MTHVTNEGYRLPLVAQSCVDGLHWLRLSLTAVGFGGGITPQSSDVVQDVQVGNVPAGVPDNLPEALLTSWTVSGLVTSGGAPAPDGTVVTLLATASHTMDEQVTTQGGAYSAPVLGLTCWDGSQPCELYKAVEVNGFQVPVPSSAGPLTVDVHVPSS